MKRVAIIGLTCGVLLGSAAWAADPHPEFSTAITHAGMAAGAPDLSSVTMHMHHVANCLAGPGGIGFDTASVNPCKDQGKGIIPDSAADKRGALEQILTKAVAAANEKDYAAAKTKAADVQADLKKAAGGSAM